VAAEATEAGTHTTEQLETMLSGLDVIQFRGQDEWLTMMMACHHATAGAGREEFVAWSIADPDYAGDAWIVGCRRDSLRADRAGRKVTVKTLYKALHDRKRGDLIPVETAAEAFADVDDLPIAATVEPALVFSGKNQEAKDTLRNAIAAVRLTGLEPALDEFKQRIVFLGKAPWMEAHGSVFDDNSQRVLRHWLVHHHAAHAYEPSKDNVFEAVSTIATHRRFNPVLDYLNGLEWDGIPRIAGLFSRYFSCEDDEYSRAVLACFMVGAVRRQRRPGCKFDTVPVLRSGQGMGKSSGIRALFGDDWFSDAELGDLKGKDAAMALAGKWGVEMAELGSLKRSDNDAFKAFASRGVDSFRPPYGRTTIDVPRRCVFIGTVNEGGYISDETGARRLWPLEVAAEVRIAAIGDDRDQLWAEAAHMEAEGAPDVLPRHLWAVAAERQVAETAGDPWADDLKAFLEFRASPDYPCDRPVDRVHTTELLLSLGVQRGARSSFVARRLRTVMEQSLGWKYRASVRIGDEVRAGYLKE